MLKDKHGRELNYLRLAVTDKCNLRCRYCMPEEGISFLPKDRLLSKDELLRLCRLLSYEGVTKVRITGGEPFVRPDMMEILTEISPWFKSINLTTNATLIGDYLEELQHLNLGSLNISLDSLNPLSFLAITKRDMFDKVWSNIEKAYDLGIHVKLNMVVMKGINDGEIADFLKLAKTMAIDVRFIEAMPFNGYDQNNGLLMDYLEIYDVIQNLYPDIRQCRNVPIKSASIRYEIPDFTGNVGIIPAYSRTLCGNCNRIRITAQGELMNCLYSSQGHNLLPLLRGDMNDSDIIEVMKNHIQAKPIDGFTAENEAGNEAFRSMTTIGG